MSLSRRPTHHSQQKSKRRRYLFTKWISDRHDGLFLISNDLLTLPWFRNITVSVIVRIYDQKIINHTPQPCHTPPIISQAKRESQQQYSEKKAIIYNISSGEPQSLYSITPLPTIPISLSPPQEQCCTSSASESHGQCQQCHKRSQMDSLFQHIPKALDLWNESGYCSTLQSWGVWHSGRAAWALAVHIVISVSRRNSVGPLALSGEHSPVHEAVC